MSRRTEKIHHVILDAEKLLEKRKVGTADKPRSVPLVDLAWEYIEARLPSHPPATSQGFERGGSSSPREVEDAMEGARLERQVIADHSRLPQLVRQWTELGVHLARLLSLVDEFERLGSELYVLAVRNTATVNPDTLPKESEGIPGCVSCARPQDRRLPNSGHFAPVALEDPHGPRRWGAALAESVKDTALCSFCRHVAVASARRRGGREVLPDDWPPLKAVDLLHRIGEQAAGRWLAKTEQGAA